MAGQFNPTGTQGVVTVYDGTVPNRLAHISAFSKNDFKLSSLRQILNTPVKEAPRGKLKVWGLGAREFPTGSFTAFMPKLTNASAGTVQDMVMATGLFTARLSTLSINGNGKIPVTLDIWMHWEGSDQGGSDSDLYLEDCDIKIDEISESESFISISFSFEVWGNVRLGVDRTAPIYAAETA